MNLSSNSNNQHVPLYLTANNRGVLQGEVAKGIYSASPSLAGGDLRLIVWLVEAFLKSWPGGSFPLKDLARAQETFMAKKHVGNIVVTM